MHSSFMFLFVYAIIIAFYSVFIYKYHNRIPVCIHQFLYIFHIFKYHFSTKIDLLYNQKLIIYIFYSKIIILLKYQIK